MRNTKNQLFQVYDFREEYGNNPDKIKHIIAKVFNEAFRNEKKHERRNCLYGEFHEYEDGVFELHHKECANSLDYIEEVFAYEKKIRQEEIKRLDEAMKN